MVFTHLDLEPNEKVIREVRRHWIVMLGQTIVTFLAYIVPPIVYLVGISYLPARATEVITSYFWLTMFFYMVWLLLFWILYFVRWTDYYLDVWYITDKRIIYIDQKRIFHREMSNLHFDKVQDVTVEIKGIVATFFKFGKLRIQNAAEDNRVYEMRTAADPDEVRRIVFELQNRGSGMFKGMNHDSKVQSE